MLQPGPIRIGAKSARSTAPNQTLAFSPTSTSPTSTALGAMNALPAIRGERPSSSTMTGMMVSVQLGAGKIGFCVTVEDLFEHSFGEAQSAPALDHHLVFENGVIAAEHDPILQPATDLPLQGRRKCLRRPAVQLVVHVALVQENGDHFILPGKGRASRQNLQLGNPGGNCIN